MSSAQNKPHNRPAFGFLPGQEVKDAGVGNIGLEDRGFFVDGASVAFNLHSTDP